MRVDVDTAAEKPPQAGDVLEVELVGYAARVSGCVEQVEELVVGVLAGVVEGVLVLRGPALDEQTD